MTECTACEWRGIPTFLGGKKTGHHRMTTAGPAYEILGSQPQPECPACRAPTTAVEPEQPR